MGCALSDLFCYCLLANPRNQPTNHQTAPNLLGGLNTRGVDKHRVGIYGILGPGGFTTVIFANTIKTAVKNAASLPTNMLLGVSADAAAEISVLSASCHLPCCHHGLLLLLLCPFYSHTVERQQTHSVPSQMAVHKPVSVCDCVVNPFVELFCMTTCSSPPLDGVTLEEATTAWARMLECVA